MAVSKVVVNTENGAETLIDLTNDTIAPETMAEGTTAHDARGEPIVGTMPTTTVLYTKQNLTEEQKAQARQNIDALSSESLQDGIDEALEQAKESGEFDGKDGSDGVSPTVAVSKSGKVTTVSITDKNGTKTATINDGADGRNGVEVINVKEKYNLDDTGAADCSALINQAIAEANTGDVLYLPNGTYKLDSTVTVNKGVNIKFGGTLKYTGTGFAFLFKNYNYSKAEFNKVQSSNGSCIKLFSDWTNERNFIQYSRFDFLSLTAKKKTDAAPGGYCIFAEPTNGWINENRFTGGQFSGGYGVYVDCMGKNGFNGNLFDSCGVESVDIGFYLANNCRNNMIFRCRHSENFTKFIQTVGECSGLKVISNSPFKVSENDISTGTSGSVIASLTSAGGIFYGTKGTFVRGTVVCDNQDRTKNLFGEPDGVFDLTQSLDYDTEYKNFVADGACSGIKLNKKYGVVGGINEFFVKFANANTKAFTITDYTGNALTYTIPQTANSTVRFYWVAETGWQFSYDFSDAEQIKTLIRLSDYVISAEAVKSVNNTFPDENGNIEIVVVEEEPIVVGSLAECTDTAKKYVLPDGYIYAYRKRFYPGGTYPNFTNQLPIALDYDLNGVYNGIGYKYDTQLNSKGVPVDSTVSGSDFLTGLIPVKLGDTVRINQISTHTGLAFMSIFDSAGAFITRFQISTLQTQIGNTVGSCNVGSANANSRALVTDLRFVPSGDMNWWYTQDLAYLAFHSMELVKPQDIIITVNEEITYTVTEDHYEWSWESTGELYIKPDYLAMIAALEERITALENK